MAGTDHKLQVKARELLRQPGLTKQILTELDRELLGIADERLAGDVGVELVAESSIDAIGVSGTLAVPWQTTCRRCLADVAGTSTVEVDERYRDDDVDPDAFPIEGDRIDLTPAVREYVLLELPDDVLCRDDCAGICPVCGADRNLAPCECDTEVRDERWAALDGLRDLDTGE